MNADNHITNSMIQQVKYQPLYGQDVIPKTWGVWRYLADGVIEEGEYSYDTGTIGPYKFTEPYTWVSEYYSKKPMPSKTLLYKYLLELNGALACIFVNNTYVCRVFTDRLEYINLDDVMQRDVRFFEEPIELLPLVNIGWVKTKVRCFSQPMLPWRLHMDVTNNKAYIGGGKWVQVEGTPKFFMDIDFPLYKQLLMQEQATAVYVDLKTGETKYL